MIAHARRAVATSALALVLAGGALAQSPPADETGRPITLPEALALARDHAPAAIQAAGQVRTGRASVRSSLAAFVPSLTLSAGTTRQYTSGENTRIENGTVVTLPSTPWSYSAGLGANLQLFDGGRRFFELRQARAGLAAAEADEVTQRYLVDLAVKQQYFNVLAARESEAAARSQLQQAEQQLRAAVLRLRAASATKSDSLRSEIQVRNARLAQLLARNDLRTANAALARLIGVSYEVTATGRDQEPVDSLELPEEELLRWAETGPDVRQAEARLVAARAARITSWTDVLPSLSVGYTRGGSGSGEEVLFGRDDLQYTGTLRFSVALPLFDQLGREERIVRARVAEDDAQAAVRDAKLAARENLTRFLGAFRTAGERVAVQATSVVAAEEDLRVQQQRYALGESTVLDVLASQTQLNEARAALIRARYDQRITRAQLEALVGREL